MAPFATGRIGAFRLTRRHGLDCRDGIQFQGMGVQFVY